MYTKHRTSDEEMSTLSCRNHFLIATKRAPYGQQPNYAKLTWGSYMSCFGSVGS